MEKQDSSLIYYRFLLEKTPEPPSIYLYHGPNRLKLKLSMGGRQSLTYGGHHPNYGLGSGRIWLPGGMPSDLSPEATNSNRIATIR